MMTYLVPILIIAILIVLNGLFVAAEFAIVAAPRARIAQRAEAGDPRARWVLSVLRDPERQTRYITTAQVGITIVSLGLGMYGEHTLAAWLVGPLEHLGHLAEPAAHTIATVVSVGFLTYLHVVIGEMVPKSLALQTAERTVLQLVWPMRLTELLFKPLILVLNTLGTVITRALGIPAASAHERLMTIEELEYIVEESEGIFEKAEQLFLENIFDFAERTVGMIMTPRTRIVGIPAHATYGEVVSLICEAGYSRYPVYEGTLDTIVGILYVKDLARYEATKPQPPFNLRDIATKRKPLFVFESLSLEDMLIRFREARTQIAIVLDEYGGTAGLITMEDLMEEVVGEIVDKFERERETVPYEIEQEGVILVRGDLLLDELNQHFDLDIEHEDVDTVGGLIMALLERVPQEGDRVEWQGITFEVVEMDGRAVRRARLILPPKAEPELSAEENEEDA